jgi:hypothetical protein
VLKKGLLVGLESWFLLDFFPEIADLCSVCCPNSNFFRKSYRRYLKVDGSALFAIDEEQIKAEARYDGCGFCAPIRFTTPRQ